jgi:MoxR-like ATPase
MADGLSSPAVLRGLVVRCPSCVPPNESCSDHPVDAQLQSLLAGAIEAHQHKGQRVDREDRSTAEHVVGQLLPDPEARSAVLHVLAELIEHAHGRGERKWAITLFDRLARFNVGAVHVAVLLSNVLFLVVDPARIDDPTRAALGPRLHRTTDSSLAAPAMELYLPAAEVSEWWPKLRDASLAFVDAAAVRDTSFWNSHSPGLMAHLEHALGRTLPRPADRRADDQPVDVAAVVARARLDLPPERITTRERALADTRTLIETHRRSLSADDLVRLMRLFNTDHEHGREKYKRFGQAMGGHARNRIVERADVANHWIDTLWACSSDAEVAAAIDRLRSDSPLPFAGLSFPAMVLHCKDPARYFPAQSGMVADGYAKLTGTKPFDGPTYVKACEGLRPLVAEHGAPPVGLDIVAYFATHPEHLDETRPSEPEAEATEAPPSPPRGGYTREQFLLETLFDDEDLAEIERTLADKPQLVLYGPPGTGKTWIAERLARLLTGGDTQRIEVVQFHPSYGYEDFIEGIRPTPDGTRMTYPVQPGVFREFCERAAKSTDTFVMVIDEINRGNLPRIFGELLFGLERRGSPVRLSQSREHLAVPPNVVVLGTMNTADQSIALLDMALRRRFHFVRLEPEVEGLERWLLREAPRMTAVAGVLRALNDKLRQHGVSRDRWVGHSHFMRPRLDEDTLQLIWRGSIMPLVEELFHGQDEVIGAFEHSTFVEPLLAAKG